MSHTYTRLLTHIVFSTKNRFPFINAELRSRLFPYIGGIVRELDGKPILINGIADHVHILTSLPPRLALSDVLRTVKANSSRWVHEQFPSHTKFAWQTGFGAFSVSYGHIERVRNYIANQEQHHRRATFQEELLNFLKEQEVEYDERYIWD
ncbi:MAG: IS200/IS605 family transposase [Ignavibacteriae bacterium]|nr:IS200/IS605 family transposase [Ignavibacteria bacterium]MBI3364028.1 IS200/IS605 family transposase [Ignavibacteriota bacterium]